MLFINKNIMELQNKTQYPVLYQVKKDSISKKDQEKKILRKAFSHVNKNIHK